MYNYNKKAIAQYNLVNNGNFEDYTTCPNIFPYNLKFWKSASNFGVEYFNTCATNQTFSVPSNLNGDNYQFPKSGNGYVGLYLLNSPTNNYRNYYQTKLKDSLRQSKKYYVEFFVVNFNELSLKSNNVSALLSKIAVKVDTVSFPWGVLHAKAQIVNYGNPIINDTLNWIRISGIYKADGGEQYLTLGNFQDDTATKYYQSQPTGYYGASIMIDDVSVIPLDSMCLKADAGKDTTITIGDSIFIGSYTNGIDSVKWLQNGVIIDSTRPGFWVKPTSTTSYVLHQVVNGCFSADTVTITVNPLPLKFISYSLSLRGTKQSQFVENIWQTANEINVSHFNIQRSINGKDFKIIGNTNAKGLSYNQYSYVDETPSEGLNYYKIMSVDKDGRTQYSEVKSVSLNKKNGISIFPNPARDIVNISCVGMKEINIINGLGQTVIHQTINNNTYKCNIQLLPKGLYLLNIITTKNYVYNEKIIVQ
jgi:Secretion system C-terminal sorting domain